MSDQPQDREDDFDDLPEEDEFTSAIRKGLEDLQSQQDDGGEFYMDKPLDDATDGAFDMVRADEAQTLVSEAELKKGKDEPKDDDQGDSAQKDAEDGEKAADDKASDDDTDGADDTDKGDEQADEDLTAAGIADLVKGMPKRTRGEVTRRLGEAEKLLAPFRGREAELEMHGTTPSEVMTRFLQINEYALNKPDEYLGWYAQQIGALGDEAAAKMDAGLKKLAEARGFRLEKAEEATDDDDPFLSDAERELKELRAKVAKLEAGGQPAPSGPAIPGGPQPDLASQAQQILVEMEAETNPDGTLKRPEFQKVLPLWAAAVKTFATKQGRAPTRDDLNRIYDDVVRVQRETFGGGVAKSAADAGSGAVSRNQDAAKRTEKARNASKLVDGAGQGATRHLALPEDAPLEDVIRANYDRIFKGGD